MILRIAGRTESNMFSTREERKTLLAGRFFSSKSFGCGTGHDGGAFVGEEGLFPAVDAPINVKRAQ